MGKKARRPTLKRQGLSLAGDSKGAILATGHQRRFRFAPNYVVPKLRR
jgi:hypothetical protein